MRPPRKAFVGAAVITAGFFVALNLPRPALPEPAPPPPAPEVGIVTPPALYARRAPVIRQEPVAVPPTRRRKTESAAEFQLGRQIPIGWNPRRVDAGKDRELRLLFVVKDHPGIEPTLNFHPFPTPVFFWSQEVRPWLGDLASAKEAQRVREGLTHYHNRADMTQRVIGNRAALSWTADFTHDGQPWVENLTCVFSPSGTAFFSVQAPAQEIDDLQSSFDIIIETSMLPTLAKSEFASTVY